MLLVLYIGGGIGLLLLIIISFFALKWLFRGTNRETEEFEKLEQEQLMNSVEGLSREELEKMLSSKK